MANGHDIYYGTDPYKKDKKRLIVICRKCNAMETLLLRNARRSEKALRDLADQLTAKIDATPCP